ncbi:hypothetical protein BsWGS_18560 [Bradybaena similaris]
MADETPRSSTRVTKSFFKAFISSLPESPLGATPRPDLRQHYPAPPPPVELKSAYTSTSVIEYTSHPVSNDKNASGFTQLRKRKSEHTQVREWTSDLIDLKPEGSTRKALLILTLIFLAALLALGVVYTIFPRP